MRIAFLFLMLICNKMEAQNNNPPNWRVIQTGIDGITFSLPSIPTSVDSLRYRFYYVGVDTTISFKVIILKDLPAPTGPVYETIIEALNTKDSIQVLSADSILYQGIVCLDGEFETPTPFGVEVAAFFRYFYFNNKLLCFFVSGPISVYGDILLRKNHFFNSVEL